MLSLRLSTAGSEVGVSIFFFAEKRRSKSWDFKESADKRMEQEKNVGFWVKHSFEAAPSLPPRNCHSAVSGWFALVKFVKTVTAS